MVNKSVKREWHDAMRERACVFAGAICQRCGRHTGVHDGVIHHWKYPAGVYERDVEELITEGICAWVCKECHNKIHIAYTLEESKHPLKNAGYCKYCGELAFGCWDRAKTLGLDYCICRKCYNQGKSRRRQIDAGQLKLFTDDVG